MKETHLYSQVFVAAAAVIERDGRFLFLQEYRPNHGDHNKWNVPAGWVDLHEDPLDAVVREAREETGVHFVPEGILGLFSIVRHDLAEEIGFAPHAVRIVYYGHTDDEPNADSSEASAVDWFTADEVRAMDSQTLRDSDIVRFLHLYESGVRYPLTFLHHTIISKR